MSSSTSPPRTAAVVLTGGGGVRLGGVDKHSIEVAGQTLLEHALEVTATDGIDEVVVVGPEVPTSRPVRFAREDPAGGGPAAGLLAGLEELRRVHGDLPERIVALAVDMPLVTRQTIHRLLATLDDATEGVLLVDEGGRRQPLCAAYRAAALVASRPATWTSTFGLPMRRLLFGLRLVEVPAEDGEAYDIDTWEDLRDLDR